MNISSHRTGMLWKALLGDHYSYHKKIFLFCLHKSISNHGTSTQEGCVNKKKLEYSAHNHVYLSFANILFVFEPYIEMTKPVMNHIFNLHRNLSAVEQHKVGLFTFWLPSKFIKPENYNDKKIVTFIRIRKDKAPENSRTPCAIAVIVLHNLQ